jgi:hypothetical protein
LPGTIKLLGLIVSDEGKKFYNIDHNWEFTKLLMNFLGSFTREVEPYCGNNYGVLKSGFVVKTLSLNIERNILLRSFVNTKPYFF